MVNSGYDELLGLVNLEAETAVLHAMRKETPAAIELVELLVADDFKDPRNAIVFEAIRILLLGIEPIDTRAILSQCSQLIRDTKSKAYIDEAYVEGLAEGDTRRYEMYANTVKKLAWLRRAGDFAYWLVQELQGRPKPEALFAEAQEKWQMLSPKHARTRFVYGWDTVRQQEEIIKERIRRHEAGIVSNFNWPWTTWNTLIKPLQRGFLAIIAAADGVGKTTYLEEIAEYWARKGVHVVYVHLEDSLEYKLDRRLARQAKVSIDSIQSGELTPQERADIAEANERLNGWKGYLHYLDAAGESMNTILSELEARVQEGVCEAVVIDYIDKAHASRGQTQLFGTNIWERQANDMEQLKTFCEKNGVVSLTATQGNKSMQGEGTQTRKAIQGSGQKSQKAQVVVILQRDMLGPEGYRHPKTGVLIAIAGEYSPIVKVRVDKQNIGKTGNFQQYMVGRFFSVKDIMPEPATPLLPEVVKPVEPVAAPRAYKDD